ncbi:MAG: ATP-binding protein [Chlamydiia bacterium]|nr:ATP-binding protein [Chlamydiia bacterium]
MKLSTFIGRKKELERISAVHKKNGPSLVVIKGRRRIGKSRLIHFFASLQAQGRLWDFAGLAPEGGMDDQSLRDHFGKQLASQLNLPPFTFTNWTDAFDTLSQHIQSGDIIVLDEISWMGSHDPSFVPKLKDWWDKQKFRITTFLCGSVSTWIEENILKSTAFFGRVNLTITLEPLSIPESYQLLKASGFQGSDYDAYKLLSILGGIPWYLEQISPGQSADDFIKALCFEKDGLLVLEFDRIFHDLFNGKGSSYKKILCSLKDGMQTLASVRKTIAFPPSGTLSTLMDHLVTAGFVEKQELWSFKTTKPLKQSLYRICDPYMRFYLKMISPQRSKIDLGGFQNAPLSNMPGFEAHIGLQLELLLLQNKKILLKAIGINPADVVANGPFRQFKTTTKSGCQIDYLIQTTTKNLFASEFKFKRKEFGVDVISQMEEKLRVLKVPRGFATIPVLFHLSGVTSNLSTSSYFYRIIDISDFLES